MCLTHDSKDQMLVIFERKVHMGRDVFGIYFFETKIQLNSSASLLGVIFFVVHSLISDVETTPNANNQ